MKKRCFMLMIGCMTLNVSLFAYAYNEAYEFRLGNFSLNIYPYGSLEEAPPSYDFFTKSDGLFFDLLTWVHYNKTSLEHHNASIVVEIDYELKTLNIYNNWESLFKDSYTQSNLPQTIRKVVREIVSEPLPDIPSGRTIEIPLYMIARLYTEETYQAHRDMESYSRTQIFFGIFKESMRNYKKRIEYLLFWDRESAHEYADDYQEANYQIEPIIINKNNVRDIINRDFGAPDSESREQEEAQPTKKQEEQSSLDSTVSDAVSSGLDTPELGEEVAEKSGEEIPEEQPAIEKPPKKRYRLLIIAMVSLLALAVIGAAIARRNRKVAKKKAGTAL